MVFSRSSLSAIATLAVVMTATGCAKTRNPIVELDEPQNTSIAANNGGGDSSDGNSSTGVPAVRALPSPSPWAAGGSGVPAAENGNSVVSVSMNDLGSMVDTDSGGIIQNANLDNVEAAIEIADLDMVHFEFDKYEISETWKAVLDEHAKWLVNHPKVHVQVEGHCDERGTDEYNISLGEKRAQKVREYLVTKGIEPTRLSTISYGKMRPLSFDQTDDAHSLNRRGMFLVYTPDFSTETAANF